MLEGWYGTHLSYRCDLERKLAPLPACDKSTRYVAHVSAMCALAAPTFRWTPALVKQHVYILTRRTTMVSQLIRNWWIPVLRGVVGILFGILVFAYPRTAVEGFVYLFGAYVLIDGVIALAFAFDVSRGRGWLVLSGIAGIAASVLTFMYPSTTSVAPGYIVAAWAIITGFFEIVAAFEWRQVVSDTWMLGFAGVLSIILGVLLFSS